jgi:hypothetical protein
MHTSRKTPTTYTLNGGFHNTLPASMEAREMMKMKW